MSTDSLQQIGNSQPSKVETEQAVRQRYAAAANELEPSLCCPVTYNPEYLKILPQEIIDRDYGCGDPSPYVNPGETILDLGSGGGKLCYIASQIVGAEGKVIGVDCNSDMLGLARKYKQEMADKIGFANVDFRCGRIQDLGLNLELLAESMDQFPVQTVDQWLGLRTLEQQLREEKPLIESDSVDCVVSNCVLNLVRSDDRQQLFAELFRVLKNGGRAAISDIVCDEDVPQAMQDDPELWSGCISGAWREDQFLAEFEKAGFHGIEIVKRESEPWQTVNGIEFRSVTVVAYKGKQGVCLERKQALVYKGPFKTIVDDNGQTFFRGERMAVCDKTFNLMQKAPYNNMFVPIQPFQSIDLKDAKIFDCSKSQIRSASETKGADYDATIDGSGNQASSKQESQTASDPNGQSCCSGNGSQDSCC